MNSEQALISVWQQAMEEGMKDVKLGREVFPVIFLRAKKLKMVEFNLGDFAVAGIEQNPKTSSRWAELARQGKRIMQFRCQGRYIANVCEGKLLRYPAWRGAGLPE